MRSIKKYLLSFIAFQFSILQGCALSSPIKGPGYRESALSSQIDDHQMVIVAVTNARLDKSAQAKDFRSRSADIYKNIEENDGYIGGSVRFKLFSNELWTLTVWRDRGTLTKFLDSRRHADAMYMTYESMTEFRHFNFEVAYKDRPRDWAGVDERLKQVPFQKGGKL